MKPLFSGCSLVGKILVLKTGGHKFESCYPDTNFNSDFMSEKNWNLRTSHGGDKRFSPGTGKNFPRHIVNNMDITHLGMGKTKYLGIYDGYRGGGLKYNYIYGLLNKFVNKPYKDFIKVFEERIKPFKSKYIYVYKDLNNVLTRNCCRRSFFYIDDEGFIRKKEHKSDKCKLTAKQHFYNEHVKIPEFGVVRPTGYKMEMSLDRKYLKPLLLGTFYVVIEKKVHKLPVYTIADPLYIEWFRDATTWYTVQPEDRKRIETLQKEWQPVSVVGLSDSQYVYEYTPNPRYTLYNDTLKLEGVSEAVKHECLMRLKYERKVIPINVGYGKFYTFVRKKDIQ